MKLWGEYSITSPALQGGISSSLAEWLRDKLKRLPPSTMILETNVGGLDEAGTYSPDFDWAGMVATAGSALLPLREKRFFTMPID